MASFGVRPAMSLTADGKGVRINSVKRKNPLFGNEFGSMESAILREEEFESRAHSNEEETCF
jgi:hypothetical protein